jgi:DNA-binding NarL/FixJ family response regulator
MTLRLVLADDDYLVREGIASLLDDIEEVQVVGLASDYPSLLKAVKQHSPDVVLTDIRMPPGHRMEGIEAARKIRADYPNIGVVVLSQHVDAEYAHELLRDGASGLGYLLKERVADIEDLVSAMQSVIEGGSVLDPKIVEALVHKKLDQDSVIATLTEREREVLDLMAQGKTNAAIGKSLFLSERAVEKHVNGLFQKLMLSEETDVNRRVVAVVTFLRETGRATM